MKYLQALLLIVFLTTLLPSLYSCKEGEDVESLKEKLTAYLVDKEGGWTARSVTVPSASATTEDQWVSFKVVFNPGLMNVGGYPDGASAVWPSGSWSMDEEGKKITRSDQVVMEVKTLTATSFKVSFLLPEGTEANGRIAALDGDYIFELE